MNQQLPLIAVSALPDGANGVYHIVRRQTIALCDFGLSGGTAAQRTALHEQPGPCGAVNGAVHTPSAQQAPVGGVDNGVHLHGGNVAFDKEKGHQKHLLFSCFYDTTRRQRGQCGSLEAAAFQKGALFDKRAPFWKYRHSLIGQGQPGTADGALFPRRDKSKSPLSEDGPLAVSKRTLLFSENKEATPSCAGNRPALGGCGLLSKPFTR